MPTSTAHVPTDRPARYGKQLVSHLSRRNGGAWDEPAGTGTVSLGVGELLLNAQQDALTLELSCPAEEVERLEDVVGRHLVRFGTRDELRVSWQRGDGSPGTSQVLDTDPS